MQRRLPFLLPVLAATLALTACDRRETTNPTTSRTRPVIAVIPKETAQLHWQGARAGALRAGKDLNVDIQWEGPSREDDREEQIKVVDRARSRGVSAILLAPLDERALRTPVANAVRAGIPVALFDSDLDSQDYVCIVETNNYRSGRLGGEHLAKLLGYRGPVMLMRVHEGSASTTQREQGFLDAVQAYPDIRVVSSSQYSGTTIETATAASQKILTTLRAGEGGVAGIFCPNESSTSGMLRALQAARLAGTIRFVGFDTSEQQLHALRSGSIDALIVQDPFMMGYMGVKALVRSINGEKVEKRIETEATVVTRTTMDDPSLQRRLHPGRDRP